MDNLVLNTGVRMDLSVKQAAGRTDCRIRFAGLGEGGWCWRKETSPKPCPWKTAR